MSELRLARADAERRTEMLTFQAGEIEAARLKPGEDEELRIERDRLANAESLAGLAQQALTLLDEGTPESPASTDLIGQVVQALTKLAQIDHTQDPLSQQSVDTGRKPGRSGPRPAQLPRVHRIQPQAARRSRGAPRPDPPPGA